MNITVVLRNMSGAQGFFEEEEYLSESDRNMISEAMTLKEAAGGTVSAVLFSNGGEDGEKTLTKACSYGVDAAYHVVINGFDFYNTGTFAKVIAKTLEEILPDSELIMFGRLAYDGDAVTVAAMSARHMGLPCVVYSREIAERGNTLECRKYISAEDEAVIELDLPAVVQTIREKGLRRQPRIEDIVRAYSEMKIRTVDGNEILARIGAETDGAVLIGETEPEGTGKKEMKVLNGVSDAETAEALIETLRALGFSADTV